MGLELETNPMLPGVLDPPILAPYPPPPYPPPPYLLADAVPKMTRKTKTKRDNIVDILLLFWIINTLDLFK